MPKDIYMAKINKLFKSRIMARKGDEGVLEGSFRNQIEAYRQFCNDDLDSAAESFKKIAEKEKSEDSYRMLGDVYAEMLNDYSLTKEEYKYALVEAIETYDTAIEVDDTVEVESYLKYLDLLMLEQHKFRCGYDLSIQALALCEEALQTYPESAELYVRLFYLTKGKEDEIAFNATYSAAILKRDDVGFLIRNFGEALLAQRHEEYDDDGETRQELKCPANVFLTHYKFLNSKEEMFEYFSFLNERRKKHIAPLSEIISLLENIFTIDPYYNKVAHYLKGYVKMEMSRTPSKERKDVLEDILRDVTIFLRSGKAREVKQDEEPKKFGDVCNALVLARETSLAKRDPKYGMKFRSPRDIKERLDDWVIGQEKAKKIASIGVYNHLKRVRMLEDGYGKEVEKSNILLLGPTGCGKTHIARAISDIIGVPFVIFDASTLTEAGYVGEDVESIFERLIDNAGGDYELALNGVVYIDEIDKLASSDDAATTRDVSGTGAQQVCLRVLEDGEIRLGASKRSKNDDLIFYTKNVLFIGGGSFAGHRGRPGVSEIMEGKDGPKEISFAPRHTDEEFYDQMLKHALDGEVEDKHLVEFGLLPEMAGRLPVRAMLKQLKLDEMMRILREPKKALFKQYSEMFRFENVNLEFTDEAAEVISAVAMMGSSGARSLRGICERVLEDDQYSPPKKKELKVDKKYVVDKLFKGRDTAEEDADKLVRDAKEGKLENRNV